MSHSKIQSKQSLDIISQNPQNKPSILIALSKLKSVQEKIHATQKRMLVINTKNQRQTFKSKQVQRRLLTKSLVQKDIEDYKKKKKIHDQKIQQKIEQSKRKNMTQKKQIKQKINRARQTCRQRKNHIYSLTKNQEKLNQKFIYIDRKNDIFQKRRKHQIVLQSQAKGRKFFQQYMINKIKSKRKDKQEETNKILNNIQQREIVLAKLQRYSSGNVGEEDSSRVVESKQSMDKSKNFRVKIMGNKGTTIITQQ